MNIPILIKTRAQLQAKKIILIGPALCIYGLNSIKSYLISDYKQLVRNLMFCGP
jgi:hypothetical protein